MGGGMESLYVVWKIVFSNVRRRVRRLYGVSSQSLKTSFLVKWLISKFVNWLKNPN